MWYRSVNTTYYVDDNDVVWRVWPDGLVNRTDMDAEVVANMCEQIDKPSDIEADMALRTINA